MPTIESSSIRTVRDALLIAGVRPSKEAERALKQNFAVKFSRGLAQMFANVLRSDFDGILPDRQGNRQESLARTPYGFKKLDVNYSTTDLGMALGLSIKTITHPDPKTKRFTKNYSRIENELRAEATDYHKRQPYSVMVAVLFLPVTACDDSRLQGGISSFGEAVQRFRHRAGRLSPHHELDLFERFFICLYETDATHFGDASFFDAMANPPRKRRLRAAESLGLEVVVKEITATFDARNNPAFEWTD